MLIPSGWTVHVHAFTCDEDNAVRYGLNFSPTTACISTRQNTLALRILLSSWQYPYEEKQQNKSCRQVNWNCFNTVSSFMSLTLHALTYVHVQIHVSIYLYDPRDKAWQSLFKCSQVSVSNNLEDKIHWWLVTTMFNMYYWIRNDHV